MVSSEIRARKAAVGRWANWEIKHQEENKRICTMVEQGYTVPQIARAFNQSWRWAYDRIRRLGLQAKKDTSTNLGKHFRREGNSVELIHQDPADQAFCELCLDMLALKLRNKEATGLAVCSKRIDQEGNQWLMIR